MAELWVDGQLVSEEEFERMLNDSQEYMVYRENEIKKKYGVSENTASAILYLRSRSRWTLEKETELIERDKAGKPISLGLVLSGEF